MDALLRRAAEEGASDVQLSAQAPPVFRVNGALCRLSEPALSAAELEEGLAHLGTPEQVERTRERGAAEFSYSLPGVGRFRVSAYRQRGSVSLAIRAIPAHIPDLDQLGAPETLHAFTALQSGLVLIGGPAGSGKSTTLAAMVERINRDRAVHVITLEDPIEYLHKHRRAIVDQREIGVDCGGFAEGVAAATRQGADVIVVGEMSDPAAVSAALTAAGTGQLVLGAVRQLDVIGAIGYLVDLFPRTQQAQIGWQLAGVLRGASAQVLAPERSGGRVAVFEVLVATAGASALVREGKYAQLRGVIKAGIRHGMRSFELSWQELCGKGLCWPEDAPSLLLPREPAQWRGGVAGHDA